MAGERGRRAQHSVAGADTKERDGTFYPLWEHRNEGLRVSCLEKEAFKSDLEK